MRNAETVLSVIRDRGKRGLPLGDVYRQLFNPELYLRAYGRIYRNDGAMTPGTTTETVDGMSMAKIHSLIDDIRHERHRWAPVRRVHIPKKNGKTRPLGIPVWKDKLLQEVMRSILEAYYEPQFSDHSHGFRPERGCHTALEHIRHVWTGTKWFIEGDITGCFDNIDHEILLSILRDKIQDERFIRLTENLLKAGYCEQWKRYPTFSGSPQGGIVSPILANIYLDRLDQFADKMLTPEHTKGVKRVVHPGYERLANLRRLARKHGRWEEAQRLLQQMQKLPSLDPDDPGYRRLRYVRYADDFLFGFIGPKSEALAIKDQIGQFLRDQLKLELSPQKTLVTHATTGHARFLGYEISTDLANTKHGPDGRRTVNGGIALRIPARFVQETCARFMSNGKVTHRAELLNESDYDIVTLYQGEYRGYVEYYGLAHNLTWLGTLWFTMETSLLRTLASKHRSSVTAMARKLRSKRYTPQGWRKCLEVVVIKPDKRRLVTRFGAISLSRRSNVKVRDRTDMSRFPRRCELVTRLLAEKCEVCGSEGAVEVHHIRKLADLNKPGRRERPLYARIMSARKRKTLVLCIGCHDDLHAGRPLERRDGT